MLCIPVQEDNLIICKLVLFSFKSCTTYFMVFNDMSVHVMGLTMSLLYPVVCSAQHLNMSGLQINRWNKYFSHLAERPNRLRAPG